jgi:hypothetical protein
MGDYRLCRYAQFIGYLDKRNISVLSILSEREAALPVGAVALSRVSLVDGDDSSTEMIERARDRTP